MLVPTKNAKETLVPNQKLVQGRDEMGIVDEPSDKQIMSSGLRRPTADYNPELDSTFPDHLVSVEDNPHNTE